MEEEIRKHPNKMRWVSERVVMRKKPQSRKEKREALEEGWDMYRRDKKKKERTQQEETRQKEEQVEEKRAEEMRARDMNDKEVRDRECEVQNRERRLRDRERELEDWERDMYARERVVRDRELRDRERESIDRERDMCARERVVHDREMQDREIRNREMPPIRNRVMQDGAIHNREMWDRETRNRGTRDREPRYRHGSNRDEGRRGAHHHGDASEDRYGSDRQPRHGSTSSRLSVHFEDDENGPQVHDSSPRHLHAHNLRGSGPLHHVHDHENGYNSDHQPRRQARYSHRSAHFEDGETDPRRHDARPRRFRSPSPPRSQPATRDQRSHDTRPPASRFQPTRPPPTPQWYQRNQEAPPRANRTSRTQPPSRAVASGQERRPRRE